MFMPGLAETDVQNNGVLENIARTEWQDSMNALRAAFGGGTPPVWQPVLLHGPPPLAPTPITQFVVDAVVATQRRRLRR